MNYAPTATAEVARALRRNATTAERVLWDRPRPHRFMGLKFRRQHSFGLYVLDFYCSELRLGIEVDGNSHALADRSFQDIERTRYFEARGVSVVRFENDDVVLRTGSVLEKLRSLVEGRSTLSLPSTSKERGTPGNACNHFEPPTSYANPRPQTPLTAPRAGGQ